MQNLWMVCFTTKVRCPMMSSSFCRHVYSTKSIVIVQNHMQYLIFFFFIQIITKRGRKYSLVVVIIVDWKRFMIIPFILLNCIHTIYPLHFIIKIKIIECIKCSIRRRCLKKQQFVFVYSIFFKF
jgi:hypothetical protein